VVDISDAICTLMYLFGGGVAPVSAVRTECYDKLAKDALGTGQRLADCFMYLRSTTDTGQTSCYDEKGNVIECNLLYPFPCYNGEGDLLDLPGCEILHLPGQDAASKPLGPPFPFEQRFLDGRDGTIYDVVTGLTWSKDSIDIDGDGKPDRLTWGEALRVCSSMGLADQGEWRLPNVRELQGLIDFGIGVPACNPVFDAVPDLYWTSTSCVGGGADWAWTVYFGVGDTTARRKSDACYVRMVRGGR
jgi:hypothetical protein